MRKWAKNDKKERKKNLLLLFLSILIFIIIFEIVLRIFGAPAYGFQKGAFQADEIVGYRLSSNYSGTQSIFERVVKVETNSEGMRDSREYDYDKKNFRILVLGDSFAFGNGAELEESYVEQLRKNFNEKTDIINLGVPGYGINNEYLYFEEEGAKYNPDIVLIQFVLNDWGTHKIIIDDGKEKIDKSNSFIANKQGIIVSENERKLRSIHLSLLLNFRVYSFTYTKLRLALSPIVSRYLGKDIPGYYFKKDSKEYQESYQGYYNIIKKLKESTNARIILFIGPQKEDLVSAEEVKKELDLDYLVDSSQAEESIKEIAKKLNIRVIEIHSDNPEIFLKIDGHWTPEGNKWVADELYLELKKLIKI